MLPKNNHRVLNLIKNKNIKYISSSKNANPNNKHSNYSNLLKKRKKFNLKNYLIFFPWLKPQSPKLITSFLSNKRFPMTILGLIIMKVKISDLFICRIIPTTHTYQ